MQTFVTAIIVTHNSAGVLEHCLRALACQKDCAVEIIVVDSGSDDCDYLYSLQHRYSFTLIEAPNVGYGKGNNLGYQRAKDSDFIVFLNPDTFLSPDYLKKSCAALTALPDIGVISGVLEGFDLVENRATGSYDSTGVFRKWYGRWYDRDQGVLITKKTRPRAVVPALCGALLVCKKQALISLASDEIFDEDFFLYKEDIELAIRLRKRGWRLLFEPALRAWHCRGWNRERKAIPRMVRLMAAKNEVLLYKKHPSPYMLWALFKWGLVLWRDV